MLTAGGGARSSLANGITRVICSAADRATIDIKSMFVLAGRSHFMHRLWNDLLLMHRYHHVRVNMLVDRSVYSRWQWSDFRRMFPFAHIGWCARSCHSHQRGAYTHSKWITVSKLAARIGGGTAVLSTSANLSTQQFIAGQSGILVVRNLPLYRAFRAEWFNYVRCHRKHHCALGHRLGRWHGANGVDVYFSPVVNNPIVRVLAKLRCTPHSTVSIMSMGILQPKFIKVLKRLNAHGCAIHTLLNPRHSGHVRTLAGRTKCEPLQHDKAVIINADGKRVVIAGSLDFNARAEHLNDNQMIRTTSRSVWTGYQAYFNRGWNRSHSCP